MLPSWSWISGRPISAAAAWKRAARKRQDLSKASVWKPELWCHADEGPSREAAVKRVALGPLISLPRFLAEGFDLFWLFVVEFYEVVLGLAV